jgi:hypothetical protein
VTTDTAAAWYNGRNGKFNSSLNFDGTDDYIDMGDPSTGSLDFGASQDFSWSSWIKTTNTSSEKIVSKWDGLGTTDAYYSSVNIDTVNKASCAIYSDAGGQHQNRIASSTNVTDGNWHHLICVRSGQNLSLYLDGRLENSLNDASIDDDIGNTRNFVIGGYDDVSIVGDFTGQIDDVRVYNYPLTPAQIKTVYNENSAVRFGPMTGSP